MIVYSLPLLYPNYRILGGFAVVVAVLLAIAIGARIIVLVDIAASAALLYSSLSLALPSLLSLSLEE